MKGVCMTWDSVFFILVKGENWKLISVKYFGNFCQTSILIILTHYLYFLLCIRNFCRTPPPTYPPLTPLLLIRSVVSLGPPHHLVYCNVYSVICFEIIIYGKTIKSKLHLNCSILTYYSSLII